MIFNVNFVFGRWNCVDVGCVADVSEGFLDDWPLRKTVFWFRSWNLKIPLSFFFVHHFLCSKMDPRFLPSPGSEGPPAYVTQSLRRPPILRRDVGFRFFQMHGMEKVFSWFSSVIVSVPGYSQERACSVFLTLVGLQPKWLLSSVQARHQTDILRDVRDH